MSSVGRLRTGLNVWESNQNWWRVSCSHIYACTYVLHNQSWCNWLKHNTVKVEKGNLINWLHEILLWYWIPTPPYSGAFKKVDEAGKFPLSHNFFVPTNSVFNSLRDSYHITITYCKRNHMGNEEKSLLAAVCEMKFNIKFAPVHSV